MEASAQLGREHTSYIKVKLDGDVNKGLTILARLAAACPPPPGAAPGARLWSVDANAAWDPPRALDFLERATAPAPAGGPGPPPIFMIEQPFPADLARAPPGPPGSAYDRGGWARFKDACEAQGVLVFADESVRTKEDMRPLACARGLAPHAPLRMPRIRPAAFACAELPCCSQAIRAWGEPQDGEGWRLPRGDGGRGGCEAHGAAGVAGLHGG